LQANQLVHDGDLSVAQLVATNGDLEGLLYCRRASSSL